MNDEINETLSSPIHIWCLVWFQKGWKKGQFWQTLWKASGLVPTLECLLSGSSLADSLFKKKEEKVPLAFRAVGCSENPKGGGASGNVVGIVE